MHLLARAIEKAKSTEGDAVRQALEQLDGYSGLIKDYKAPFATPAHEALSPEDYIMVRYEGGKIVPVQ
jgi:branched-chain amino acid transport system substrate-binding protein